MACCGRKNKGINRALPRGSVPPSMPEPKAAALPPLPPPPARIIQPPATPITRAIESPKHVPQSTTPTELPPCRYRDFKSRQVIGGRQVDNYYCRAFKLSIREEHCRACQKHDK